MDSTHVFHTDEEYHKFRIFQGVILIENFARRWMELIIFVLSNHSRTWQLQV